MTVARGEYDEFIRPEHTDYLVATIPGARRVDFAGASHFAMLQTPDEFNRTLVEFLSPQ